MTVFEQRADGKLEFQFNGKLSIIDPKQPDAITELVRLIVNLDLRLAKLEGRL